MGRDDKLKYSLINVPKHIGIIVDGNYCWAQKQNMPMRDIYVKGEQKLKDVCEWSSSIDVKYLTIFVPLLDNSKYLWEESSELLDLMNRWANTYFDFVEKDIRIRVIGDRINISEKLKKCIEVIEKGTIGCKGLVLNILFNYNGKEEIINAITKAIKEYTNNKTKNKLLNLDYLEENLYSKGLPEPEMVLRTGGKIKTSGFLLWKASYSELVFSEKMWLELTQADFYNAIEEYGKRDINRGE